MERTQIDGSVAIVASGFGTVIQFGLSAQLQGPVRD